MWCPKCRIDYRKGITVCADCGTELVERPDDEAADICEMTDEKAADEIVEYPSYSGIEEVTKEKVDEIEEDTTDLLYASNKKEYTKYADKYHDTQLSGVTFIVFGLIGIVYLILSKTKVIPIQYHAVVFCIIAALFVGLTVSGIVSIVKASKLKVLIPQEEEKTKAIKEWLGQNLTKEMVEGWSDNNASEGENDLVITAHIRTMLVKEYKGELIEYLEMIADEYFEEHYLEK